MLGFFLLFALGQKVGKNPTAVHPEPKNVVQARDETPKRKRLIKEMDTILGVQYDH